jgi:twitching motility two-component system response regulator PilH
VARILLVEDDPDQREVYEALLYYNGFDVLVAADGESGLRSAIEEKPDAILMDVMLPGLNGLAASSLIHSNPDTAHIPIICMSAYDVMKEQVLRSGANDLLPKPITGDALVRTIRRYIGWDDVRQEVPSQN